MLRNAIAEIEAKYQRNDVPDLRAGDSVRVHTKIKEGDKERVQIFEGVIIARRKGGVRDSFTARRCKSCRSGFLRGLPIEERYNPWRKEGKD